MCLFIETIKIENGIAQNLEFHQSRFDATRKKMGFKNLSLSEVLKNKSFPERKTHKCSIVYENDILNIKTVHYKPISHTSFTLMEEASIDYSFKYKNRGVFENLKNKVEDEIIVTQNGFITDTSYANLIFYDKKQWYTPKTYLLNGTTRQRLLKENQIIETQIHKNDLKNFVCFKPINAMLNYLVVIPNYGMDKIVF